MKKLLILIVMLGCLLSLSGQDIYDDSIPMITKDDIIKNLTSTDLEPNDSLSVSLDEQYRLQKGDQISIIVMEHGEFTKKGIKVLPDGGIEYPLLGNIRVENMTVSKLREIIEKKLLPYVTIPVVTIYVDKIYGHKISILGYVNQPGDFQIYESMKLTDALALAKGITNIRDVSIIRIIRVDGEVFNVNIEDIWFSEEISEFEDQLIINAGDTIIIPPPREFPWHIYTAVLATLSFMLSVYTALK